MGGIYCGGCNGTPPLDPLEEINKWYKFILTDNFEIEYLVANELSYRNVIYFHEDYAFNNKDY